MDCVTLEMLIRHQVEIGCSSLKLGERSGLLANKWDLMRLPRERTEREGKGSIYQLTWKGSVILYRIRRHQDMLADCKPGNLHQCGSSRAMGRAAQLEWVEGGGSGDE